MSDTFNNQAETEQVSKDMFGFTETKETKENDSADKVKWGSSSKKTSFAELRQGRKVPRLKKSLVLTMIAGGIFAFLIIVNLFIQKKEEQKKYFDEQKGIAVGNDFSLGDLERKHRYAENDMAEGEEVYFVPPPPYEPLPARNVPPKTSGVSPSYVPVSSGSYSDSDLLAMRAQIGKDGGYGTAKNINYAPLDSGALTQAGYFDNQPGSWAQIPTREEYTRQRMDAISQLSRQTDTDKANNGRYSEAGRYNPDNPQQGDLFYLNDNCLFPGTIIHALLVSRIDTDYPGPIHARVTENVYDSMTGNNLLIPQGTILQGNYSSSSIGVAKVQIAWESMVINYGGTAYQVSLGGMAGVDKRGRTGIAGTLDDHYFEWLKAAGIVSLFTMLNSEVSYQTKGQNDPQIRELMDINQGIANMLGNRIMERALDIQPTVRVANGTAVSVAVNTVVNLRPFQAIGAEEKWIRK